VAVAVALVLVLALALAVRSVRVAVSTAGRRVVLLGIVAVVVLARCLRLLLGLRRTVVAMRGVALPLALAL
jgi:hypothetical protein